MRSGARARPGVRIRFVRAAQSRADALYHPSFTHGGATWPITSKGACSKSATAACCARAGSARTPTTAPATPSSPGTSTRATIDGVDVAGQTIALIAHVPGNILQGNWRAAVYLDDKASRRSRRRRSSSVYTGKLGGPVAELAKLVGEVVSVEKVPITFDVHGGKGTIKIGDAGYAELEPYKSATGAHDDADRHGVLDGARRAGVRRQVAALPLEEREARHRPRHQGPQRAAEHVRLRRLRPRRRGRVHRVAAPADRAPMTGGRSARATRRARRAASARCCSRAAGRAGALAWSRCWSGARAPTAAISTTAAGPTPAALAALCRAVPQGELVVPAAAPRAALGADDRGDDAADDAAAARAASAAIVARPAGRRAGLSALVVAGYLAAWFAFGLVAHAAGWRCAVAVSPRRRLAVARLGARRGGAGRRRRFPVQRAQVPLPRASAARRSRSSSRAGTARAPAREALAARRRPRRLLRRLLLGADAADVRRRHRQPGLDAGAGRA